MSASTPVLPSLPVVTSHPPRATPDTTLPGCTDDVPLIPVRMLNEFAYCPRLAYLEWVQGEWADNLETLEGQFGHRNVDRDDERPLPAGTTPPTASVTNPAPNPDDPAGPLPPAPNAPTQFVRTSPRPPAEPEGEDRLHARSLQLESLREGVLAKLDLLELEGNTATPVDYKRGKVPTTGDDYWEPEAVQLCAQALILRDNGFDCRSGVIYYIAARKRVEVEFHDQLIARTRQLIAELQVVARAGQLPPPLEDSPKCPRCSLVGICLPDETNFLRAWRTGEEPQLPTAEPEPAPEPPVDSSLPSAAQVDAELWSLFTGDSVESVPPNPVPPDPAPQPGPLARQPQAASPAPPALRRLIPELDLALPLYVQSQGAMLGKTGDRVTVKLQGAELVNLRLLDVSQVCLFGNVMVSAQALRELMARNIPICHFSYGGWFSGLTTGLGHRNVELRIQQYRLAGDRDAALRIARAFIAGKLRNARTLLRRHLPESGADVLKQLAAWIRQAERAESAESLLGIEGMGAKEYFAGFFSLLPNQPAFDPRGRNRRPPRDPVNAVLSFVYALLTKELTVALQSVGFDPLLGFLHRPRYGRPSLALDLMEEFRPLIADSTTLTAFNNGELSEDSFVSRAGAVCLTEAGRKSVLSAYERRLQQEVTHPLFGYRVSYRRILHVQARLLARHVLGELPEYPSFTTR